MELQASILAALIGAVFMTLSSTTEMHWRQRPESTAPGRGLAFWLRFVGIRIEDGTRAMNILSTWAHWLYGAFWGVLWWILIEVGGLNLWLTAILFFVIVWGTAATTYVLYGIAPWPWKWGGFRWVLLDWTHHVAYVGGTVVGWVALEKIVGSPLGG